MNATRMVPSRGRRSFRSVRRTRVSACVIAVVLAVAGRTAAQEVPSVARVLATTQDVSSSDDVSLTSPTPTPFIDGYGGEDINLETAMAEWLQDQQRRQREEDEQKKVEPLVVGDRNTVFETKVSPTNVSAYSNLPTDQNDFVRVSGTRFLVGCPPTEYKIVGWNTYTLIEQAAEVPVGSFSADFSKRGKMQVLEMLDAAQLAGFNTVRTWAYNVGEYQPFQVEPGVYHEPSFNGLDWVLHQASKRGVKLILVLTDYWEHNGGVSQYQDWAAERNRGAPSLFFGPAQTTSSTASKSSFFSDPACKRMYKDNAKALIERVNTYTGVRYKNDPTIFAWELINEPRCRGCGDVLQNWIEEMAKYVKSLDSNHLLSTGEEGFYASDSRGSQRVNPEVWAATTGQDFIKNHAVPEIDFAVAHLWPDNWGVFTLGGSLGAEFTEEWIRVHARDSMRVLGKPFVLEEFGVVGGRGANSRGLFQAGGGFVGCGGAGGCFGGSSESTEETSVVANYYRDVYSLVERADSADRALRGSMFWTWHHEDLKPLAFGTDEYSVFTGDDAFEATKKHASVLRDSTPSRRGVRGFPCVRDNNGREVFAIGGIGYEE